MFVLKKFSLKLHKSIIKIIITRKSFYNRDSIKAQELHMQHCVNLHFTQNKAQSITQQSREIFGA